MVAGTITYITKHGERTPDQRQAAIDLDCTYFPAVDSDENGDYKIEWDDAAVPSSGGSGGAGGDNSAGEAALAAGHPALARLVHAYAGAEGRGDWAAGNLRMLFDSAPPEHLREAGGSKWHFL
mgnify:CR=1 FL=1